MILGSSRSNFQLQLMVKLGSTGATIGDRRQAHNDNLPIHEDKSRGFYVKNLSDYYVGSASEVYEIMKQGGEVRKVSSTIMNAESSQSHSIFVITIQQKHLKTGTQKSGNLFLVDLAGSEKVEKTGVSGQTLEEAKKINKSLSALGMVINALNDGKSVHIPYRDSKLTRILQESLGGNSRTTLVINCSPSGYNEAETLSTLQFGMRAKLIKNKAQVNAKLPSAELKALLKKAQGDSSRRLSCIALLERELTIWQSGGQVNKSDWASMEKALGVKLNVSKTGAVNFGSRKTKDSGRETPSTLNSQIGPKPQEFANIPALDALRELGTRPETPIVGLEKDKQEEFFLDEEALSKQERTLQEIQEELSFFMEQESSMSEENKVMESELNELRLQMEKLSYENKEALILNDATREQNLKAAQKLLNDKGKQRKKAEKMAQLMAGFEFTAVSEKEDEIRATLPKLDDAANVDRPLSTEDLMLLKRQLTNSQILANESAKRARKAQEEIDLPSRRKEELENRLTLLEQDYEDLSERASAAVGAGNLNTLDDVSELESIKAKLEAQAALKRKASLLEITNLKQQVDIIAHENKSLLFTIENLKTFAVTAAGIKGGKDLAESAKEMEQIRNRYNNLLWNSNSMAQQQKTEFLTLNLDQLTNVQKQLVEQNSMLKKDAKFEAQLNAVCERLSQAHTHQEKAPIGGGLVFGRIAKLLRGGGGASSNDADSSKRTLWFSRK
ncbi:hypothetical protein BY996DRAFT_6431983 [Phakopsora pachyrhizi]|nr:hypothetical protein BY996DRAFT_6431983 [Phakopsora pachyrhizi]